MAVLNIKEYRQKNSDDVLKVLFKPTKVFPEGYFYCDASDEELVKKFTWFLHKRKYVMAGFGSYYSQQHLFFHREKKHNLLGYYPKCINHINGIEFDNVNKNLDEVSQQQNCWCKPSKGYKIAGKSFEPVIVIKSQNIWGKCISTEVKACQVAYLLELQYRGYRYDFLKDRRKDLYILDLERTGQISEEEAIYRHVLRYAADNAWYVYRYDLFNYFKDNHLKVPAYSIDFDGFMTHPITGHRLCPL